MNESNPTPEMLAFAEQYRAEKLKYNGWPNYETWRVNLELTADYCDGLLEDGQTFKSTADLADALKNYVESIIDEQPDGLAKDYANAFVAAVNWFSIASHYEDLIATPDAELDAAGLEPDDDCFQ